MREEYYQHSDDEIDLIELLITLWRGKWTILLIMVVFGALGLAYAKFGPKTWTSQAEIAPAKYADVSDYIELRRRYEIILGGSATDVNGNLFSNLRQDLLSRDKRVEYVRNSDFYQTKLSLESIERDSKEAQIILEKIVDENISVEFPGDDLEENKKQDGPKFVTVRYSAPEQQIAKEELTGFLNYISATSFKEYKRNFMAQLKNLIGELEAIQAHQKRNIEISKNSTLDELKQALKISNAAGIDELVSLGDETNSTLAYLITSNVISSADTEGHTKNTVRSLYPFMMGSKNLTSQVEVLENNPTIYPVAYQQREANIKELQKIIAEFENLDDVKVYRYVSSPNYPIESNELDGRIIVLICMFLGILVGMVIVLLSGIFNKWRVVP